MPTTLPMIRGYLLLSVDRGDQVVDVLAFEQLLTQRLERRFPLGGRRLSLPVIPLAELLDPPLVLVALTLDGRPRLVEPGAQLPFIAARLATLANFVEFLVQRKHFF